MLGQAQTGSGAGTTQGRSAAGGSTGSTSPTGRGGNGAGTTTGTGREPGATGTESTGTGSGGTTGTRTGTGAGGATGSGGSWVITPGARIGRWLEWHPAAASHDSGDAAGDGDGSVGDAQVGVRVGLSVAPSRSGCDRPPASDQSAASPMKCTSARSSRRRLPAGSALTAAPPRTACVG